MGCGEQPRGAAVPRTPWHRASPPRSRGAARRGEARRQLGPAGVSLPNSWPRPGGLQERRGGGVARGLQAAGPSPASSLSGAGHGGRPRKGGAPGLAAGSPRGARRTKGDGDGSSVVKTTCAGGGPRPGRGLGALRLNPFPAAAAWLPRLPAADPAGPPGLGAGFGAHRGGAGAGRDPGTPRSRLPSPRSGSRLLLPRPPSHLDSG